MEKELVDIDDDKDTIDYYLNAGYMLHHYYDQPKEVNQFFFDKKKRTSENKQTQLYNEYLEKIDENHVKSYGIIWDRMDPYEII